MRSDNGLPRLRTGRHELKGLHDELLRLIGFAGALEDAGDSQVFRDGLLVVTEALMYHGEAGMGQGVLRAKRGDTPPVLEGLVDIALVQEQLGGAHGGVDSGGEVADTFGDLTHLFQGHRVILGDQGDTLIRLQSLLELAELEQGKSQAVEGSGLIREFLESLPIGGGGLFPILIPGGRMAFVHRSLVDIFSLRHGSIITQFHHKGTQNTKSF